MINKNILFFPRDKEVSNVLNAPKPAKQYVPNWYKKMGSSWKNNDGFMIPGPTRCLPFLDSFTSGYIHELACDIEFIKDSDNLSLIKYKWSGSKNSQIRPLITRQEENGAPKSLPSFDGYYDIEFQWYTMWDSKTPKGYSTIYQHPINRFDLPFMTMTGIIDTDKWWGSGPIPFLLKKDFEGIIEAGTPIIQFIPFKRDNWKSKDLEYDEKRDSKKEYTLKKYIKNGYKKIAWSKKSFT